MANSAQQPTIAPKRAIAAERQRRWAGSCYWLLPDAGLGLLQVQVSARPSRFLVWLPWVAMVTAGAFLGCRHELPYAGPSWSAPRDYRGPSVEWRMTSGMSWTPVLLVFDVPGSGYAATLDEVHRSADELVFRVTLIAPASGNVAQSMPSTACAAVPFHLFFESRARSTCAVEVRQVLVGEPDQSDAAYVRALELR